jgi:pimeloyl-ACP methyl ester carboxylesterase
MQPPVPVPSRDVGLRRSVGVAWRFARLPLIAYFVVVLAVMILETWLVYPIPPLDRGDWHPTGLDFEDVHFTSADGTKLHGWFVERAGAKRAILYCHGNGENVAMNAEVIEQLSQSLDASIFVFDYRGYGHSEGSPTEAGCIADGLAAQRWLAQRIGKTPGDVVVMGRSIGGAIATAVASAQGAKALVLINAFSRMTDVAAEHYRWLPVRWVMKNRYDSIARIRNYAGPVFQSHGTNDWIVPIRFGRELFEAAPSAQKQFVELSGYGHNDFEPADFYGKMATFLDRVDQNDGVDHIETAAP